MVDQSCGCHARTCHRRQTRPQTATSEEVSSEKTRRSRSSLRRSNRDVLCDDDVDVDHFFPCKLPWKSIIIISIFFCSNVNVGLELFEGCTLQAARRASVVTWGWMDGAEEEEEMSLPGVGGGCGRGDLRGARCCGGGANGDGVFLQTKYSDL